MYGSCGACDVDSVGAGDVVDGAGSWVALGFVVGAAWLFIATARGFGEAIRMRPIAIGIVLSVLVFLFFTRVLGLALPAGPLESLLLG